MARSKCNAAAIVDGRQVCRAVKAHPHLVQRGEVRRFLERGNSAAVNDGHAKVVDPLVPNKIMRIPEGIENFSRCNRSDCVLTNEAERLLVLGGRGVFHPEKMMWLELLAKARSLDRCEAVMHIVQQVQVFPNSVTHGLKKLWSEVQVALS